MPQKILKNAHFPVDINLKKGRIVIVSKTLKQPTIALLGGLSVRLAANILMSCSHPSSTFFAREVIQ